MHVDYSTAAVCTGPRGIELVARADAAAAAQLPGGSPATGPPADLLPGAAAGTLLAATGNAAVNGLGSSHEWTAAQLHLQQQPQQGGDGISVGDMHTAGISASGAATVCSASRAVHRLQLLSQARPRPCYVGPRMRLFLAWAPFTSRAAEMPAPKC